MKSRLLALTLTILLVGCGPLYTDSQEGPAHRGLYSALVHNNSWYAYEVRFYCDGHSQPFDRIFLRGKGETVRETIRAKVPCSRGIVVAVRLEGRRMFPLSDGQPLNVYPGDQIVITLQDHAPLSSVVVVPGRQG